MMVQVLQLFLVPCPHASYPRAILVFEVLRTSQAKCFDHTSYLKDPTLVRTLNAPGNLATRHSRLFRNQQHILVRFIGVLGVNKPVTCKIA